MPQRSSVVFQILIAAALLSTGGGVSVLLVQENKRSNAADVEIISDPLPLISTEIVVAHTTGFEVKADGNVIPHRDIQIATEVGGRVTYKNPNCRRGNQVKKGDVLLRIDRRDYELEVERLTQEETQAEVNIAELDIEIANTRELLGVADEQVMLRKRDMARLVDLTKREAVTDAQIDESRSNELTARNAQLSLKHRITVYATRKNRLKVAKQLVATQLKRAKLDLSRTEIVAPIDGVVIDDLVEQDSYVQKGTAIFVVEDTSAVEVLCGLRMEDLAWLRGEAPIGSPDQLFPQRPAVVQFRIGKDLFEWPARLDRFDGLGLDRQTRTAPCRIVVENPISSSRDCDPNDADCVQTRSGLPLLRGMYVSVKIETPDLQDLLRIPSDALRPGDVVWSVFDGKLQLHKIEAVRVIDDDVLIRSEDNLKAGSQVVVSPISGPYNGMVVQEAAR